MPLFGGTAGNKPKKICKDSFHKEIFGVNLGLIKNKKRQCSEMGTGYRGTFVISWSQTEADGIGAAPPEHILAGATWRWSGQAIRVDGPSDLLLLDGAMGMADIRRRAARIVRRKVGFGPKPDRNTKGMASEEPVFDAGFVVTDGRRAYSATVIQLDDGMQPILMFLDELPPVDTSLWVVSSSLGASTDSGTHDDDGVICFTAGTMIRTPDGAVPVEQLCEGDLLQTKDDGAQKIIWTGMRRMSGARLYAMPHLRPIRIRADALNHGEPDRDLVVSPEHRLLIKGTAAEALFGTAEVLVRAGDLVNDKDILTDHGAREVTYIHLMLERHQIIWANGVETESFHPAAMPMRAIDPEQREHLFRINPDLQHDPHTYGDFARRNLSRFETEIMKYDGIFRH